MCKMVTNLSGHAYLLCKISSGISCVLGFRAEVFFQRKKKEGFTLDRYIMFDLQTNCELRLRKSSIWLWCYYEIIQQFIKEKNMYDRY